MLDRLRAAAYLAVVAAGTVVTAVALPALFVPALARSGGVAPGPELG
ncbi:hypothetical protein [Micromonospora sp. NPDC093277]